MNDEEMKEFMKRKYPELVDFDNLQFVKDCKEEGIKEYKKKIKEVIERLKERFGARPKAEKGEEQDRFISYLDFKKELGLE